MIHKRTGILSVLALLGACAIPAQAQLVNPGFEAGGFAPWTTIGDTAVVGAVGTVTPDTGTSQARLTTEPGSVPPGAIETFLGLTAGSLNGLIGGTVTEGSAMKQTITVTAGQTISFRYNFLTNEFTPDATYNDMLFFSVVGPGATLVNVADTFSAPWSPATGTIYFEMTGWRTFTHTFTAAGSVTIGIGILDKTDNIVNSAVFIDQGGPPPAGVTITQTGGTTTTAEGGTTDTYTVVLNTAPTANVTVTMNPGTQVTVAPATLTFTPANFNTAQTVTVTAVDDAVVEGVHSGTVAHTAASTDAAYNAVTIASVTVSITDNDIPTPGVTVTQSGGSTTLAEGGTTDTYTVVLNTAPTANVTITINPGSQVTVAPATLTFTTANFATAQTVTVMAVDDALTEGTHTGTITHTSASTDAGYNAIAIASVTVTITDNDISPAPPEGSYGGGMAGPFGPEGSFAGSARSAKPAATLVGPFVQRTGNGGAVHLWPVSGIPHGITDLRTFNIAHQARPQVEAAPTSARTATVAAWTAASLLVVVTGLLVVFVRR